MPSLDETVAALQSETAKLTTGFAVLDTTVTEGFRTIRADLLRVLEAMNERTESLENSQAQVRAHAVSLQKEATQHQLQLTQMGTRVEAHATVLEALSARMTQINADMAPVQTAVATLPTIRAHYTATNKTQDELTRRVDRLEVICNIVSWIGMVFAGSILALVWGLITGKVQLNFL